MGIHMIVSCFGALLFLSTGSNAATDFDVQKLATNINTDQGETIQSTEIDAFFNQHWGISATRCEFESTMHHIYSNNAALLSVMFDVVKASNEANLTQQKFREAFLGASNTPMPVATFISRLEVLLETAEAILKTPYEHTSRPGMSSIEAFTADRLASVFDRDVNGLVTEDEVSQAMKQLVDVNGDHYLKACEFVEAMRAYNQNTATAANSYLAIFKGRDETWSDKDSLFFLVQVNRFQNAFVTQAQVKEFFEYYNLLESGQLVLPDGSPVVGDTASRRGAALWILSATLVTITVTLNTLLQ